MPYTAKTDIYSLALTYSFVSCKFPVDSDRIGYFYDLRVGTLQPSSIVEQQTTTMDDGTKRKYFEVIKKMLSLNPGAFFHFLLMI